MENENRRTGLGLIILIICLAIGAIGYVGYLTYQDIQDHREFLKQWAIDSQVDVQRLNDSTYHVNLGDGSACFTIEKFQDSLSMTGVLDELSDEAREIGAVNVIRVRKGKLKGFNSDIIGFTESIRPLLQPHHTKALILGTGGASRAIRVGLSRLGIEWTYVTRSPREKMLAYSDLTPEMMKEYSVIINCSPVGMFPKVDQAPAIPYELLTPKHLLFDLVYNPEDTLFMQKGREQGAIVKNGLEMLFLQAVASWRFWNED